MAVLPPDPDASARAIRQGLHERLGVAPAVIISDTLGRPGVTDSSMSPLAWRV